MVKSKLSPYSGSVAIGQVNPIHKKGYIYIYNTVCDQEIAQAMLFAETSF